MKSYCNAKKILDGLWLCDLKAAEYYLFLKQYNIKYIINLSAQDIKKFTHIKYIDIPIKDSDLGDISYCVIKKLFDYCADIINMLLINGFNVVINCKRGHHRSASMIVAYLIKHKGYSLENAINFIRNKRPLALRGNRNILFHMITYYEDLQKISQ